APRDSAATPGTTHGEHRAWHRSILRPPARTFRRRYRDVAMRGVSKEIPLESLGAESDALLNGEGDKETPHANVIRRESHDRIERALLSLPERQRLTLIWKTKQGKSFREIGEHLGCSGPNAYKLWVLALETLRVRLQAC
ncbi:MAG: RNA polymerase sigma factor, partial [Isosphaeraceae bacterium]